MAIKVDLDLDEFIPDEYEIPLVVDGKRPEIFTLRSFNLRDFKWLKKISGFSVDKFGEALKDFDVLAKLLFRLVQEKEKLGPIEVTEYDKNDKEVKIILTGPDRLLGGLNLKNQQVLVSVLNQMMQASMPKSDGGPAEDFKKNEIEVQAAVQNA